MKKYFNFKLELGPEKVDSIIVRHIDEGIPGYVCSVEGTNASIAAADSEHLDIINGAIVNICDSTWLPVMINRIYGKSHENYCGADLFIKQRFSRSVKR